MKIFLSIFSLLCCFSFAQAQNTNITLNSDLSLNCKFEKVILKNPDHNFVQKTTMVRREFLNVEKPISLRRHKLIVSRLTQLI